VVQVLEVHQRGIHLGAGFRGAPTRHTLGAGFGGAPTHFAVK